ncbi:MAG TPA: cytochrome c oxidase subunit II, partial [Candidatus Limnocylindrales bacterium]|nr:cytochrome c oxidase subunit II [Candidatus Limnocylindrales bacterium]
TFAVVRYRGRPDGPLPRQVTGSLWLEVVWTAIPIAIVLALFAGTLAALGRVEALSPNPSVELRVTAFRWGWTFEYPREGVSVGGVGEPGPEVVVPVGEPVRVTLTGNDVVHAFFVPEFLFKRDATPGRETRFEFTVDEPGTYRGQCAEFCGIYHARMPFTIRAVTRAEYDAWLAERRGAHG